MRRGTRNGERGTVLLVALLVLLVLAALALVVVQQVAMEIRHVGSFRISKQGFYVTEAGLTGPVAKASEDQNVFLGFLQQSSFEVRTADIASNFYDFDTWGSFGPEFASAGAASFVTYFSDPVDTNRVPGFSTLGFCYRRYTVTADGFLGTGGVDVDVPESVDHTAQARFVSQLFLGPFQCGH